MSRWITSVAAALALCVGVFVTPASAAENWPQFLGPTRDGVYRGDAKLAITFPESGPPVVWRKRVGEGFSAPVLVDGKLILFHRVEDKQVVDCLDAKTGDVKWTHSYTTDYSDDMRKGNGPRGTPAIADGHAVTFGPEGVLQAIDFKTGKPAWSIDTKKEYRSQQGFFGRACSPLIEDGKVLLNIGGERACIGAFDLKTGKRAWTGLPDEAGYASPVCATIGKQRYAFFFTRTGLAAVDPSSGKVMHEHRWRSRQHASVNAASPLVVGDLVVLSSSYETGAIVLDFSEGKPKTLWSGDEILSSQYTNILHQGGYLYGFDGRNDFGDTRLRCVDLKTGKVQWTQDKLAAGPSILAGDKLIILLEGGELLIAEASPKGFRQLHRSTIFLGPVRAYPALVDGLLYARDGDTLICVDLRGK